MKEGLRKSLTRSSVLPGVVRLKMGAVLSRCKDVSGIEKSAYLLTDVVWEAHYEIDNASVRYCYRGLGA